MANDIMEELYVSKETNYFSLERQMFKDAILENNLNILDIGCGTGILGAYFKKNQNCNVTGIEINQNAFEAAKLNLDNVIKGNIETLELPFNENFFDVIIMGDVLEHLVNPITTLLKIKPLLKKDGRILITVPNVRNWNVLIKLLFQDSWEYADWGILDYTHMRFFTLKSTNSILKKNNIKIERAERIIQKPSKSYVFNTLTCGIFEGFLASHIFLTLKK
jgi:methionine biosynthesis protein MetW